MRPFTRLLLLAVPFLAAASLTAQTLVDPSGHWEGSVMVPNAEVAVEIDLAKGADSDLAGTFGAPDQNLRGLPLGNIVVKDRSLSFQVKGGPPGERAFSGTISDDGQLLSGDYSQGGYTIPFLLTRKGGPQLEAPARSAAISKALEGILGRRHRRQWCRASAGADVDQPAGRHVGRTLPQRRRRAGDPDQRHHAEGVQPGPRGQGAWRQLHRHARRGGHRARRDVDPGSSGGADHAAARGQVGSPGHVSHADAVRHALTEALSGW